MPLILSRKAGETLVIDGPATVQFLELCGNRVVVQIVAAPEVNIRRGELVPITGHNLPKKIGGKWRRPQGGANHE